MVDMLGFAKILNNTGEACGFDRDDFHHEIEKRAAATRVNGETSAQAYTRVLLTAEGKELYKAYRTAPVRQAPQDIVPTRDRPEPKGPAAAELDRLVEEFVANYNRTTTGRRLSRQQGYSRVIELPENRRLRDAVRREEQEATLRIQQLRAPIWSAESEFERDFRLGRSPGSARN
jgi:hypothetical protein